MERSERRNGGSEEGRKVSRNGERKTLDEEGVVEHEGGIVCMGREAVELWDGGI